MESTPRPSGRTSPADYLEEAADAARKAQDRAEGMIDGKAASELFLRAADVLARCAAIERGLLPPEMTRPCGGDQ